jgi:hypothetical protein
MKTETQAPPSRPRSWLLIVLGVMVVALIITRGWSHFSADSPAGPSNQTRRGQPARTGEAPLDPNELQIRLGALETPRPERGDAERDPFRFKPKPAPPPMTRPSVPVGPVGPPPPPPVPPIPLKLMGFVELPSGLKLASLSDCKGATWSVREGENVDGQYRVVKLGLESIVIEYISGKGRQTMRVDGCPPR